MNHPGPQDFRIIPLGGMTCYRQTTYLTQACELKDGYENK